MRTPERYIRLISESGSAVGGEETVDAAGRAREALALSLRTRAGVPSESLVDAPELDGLVSRADGRARLTPRGRLLATVVAQFLA